jgi:SPP1 family phage portal protein
MNIDQLNELVLAGDMNVVMSACETHLIVKNLTDVLKEYNPKFHAVHDPAKRKDKVINDDEGNFKDTVKVTRLSLPMQKKIVLTAAAFLGSPCLSFSPVDTKEEDFQKVIEKTFEDNKLDYKFKKIAKTTMAERHCAELWYTLPAEADYWDGQPINGRFKLKMRLLANSLGDSLYPVFDMYGDMIAFGRAYYMHETDKSGKVDKVHHFDLYTADRIYYTKSINGSWVFNYDLDNETIKYTGDKGKGIPNPIGKIPVVYYSQLITEWEDVQECIDRLETIMSNHADTNDYNGSPTVVADGEVEGYSKKGEQGKFIQTRNGAKVYYLTWDSAPESIKLEMENLFKAIYTFTHTPDVSFDNLKGLGYFSTVALQTMFVDAHLKATDKEEIFGEGIQRRLNYVKRAIAEIDASFMKSLSMKVKPVFEYFLPKNVGETIDMLVKAVSGGLISQETAVENNPIVENPTEELERINKEKAAQPKPPVVVPPAQNSDPNLQVA